MARNITFVCFWCCNHVSNHSHTKKTTSNNRDFPMARLWCSSSFSSCVQLWTIQLLAIWSGVSNVQEIRNDSIESEKHSNPSKKHGMESGISTAKSLLESFKTQIEEVKRYGSIDPYRVDDVTYKGVSCTCGKVFQLRKDSAIRHCQKGGCDPTKLQQVNLTKLCCGSYVSLSQIESLFMPPHITKQFDTHLVPTKPWKRRPHLHTYVYPSHISMWGSCTIRSENWRRFCRHPYSTKSNTRATFATHP